MIFRTNKGELIEIKKYNYSNDKLYYEKVMKIKKPLPQIEKVHDACNNTLKCENN